MDTEIDEVYGQRLRVRVCGLCWRDNKLLVVNHRGLSAGAFWAPPGGGLLFGESVDQALQRELFEETGLQIQRRRFAFACEFLRDPLHAIELFFEVSIVSGEVRRGADPELNIIEDARFMTMEEISALPVERRHGIFSKVTSAPELRTLTGFFTI